MGDLESVVSLSALMIFSGIGAVIASYYMQRRSIKYDLDKRRGKSENKEYNIQKDRSKN